MDAGSLDRIERAWFFNDEDLCTVPLRVEAEFAQVSLGNVAALTAECQSVLHRPNRIGQTQGIVPLRLHEVESQPLCALLTDSGETNEFLDQPRQ
jgi:hypothetical protein